MTRKFSFGKYWNYSFEAELNFQQQLFPSLVSHDPSEIILIKCGTQEKFLIIINVEKSFIYIKYLTDHKLLISSVYIYINIYISLL